MNYKRKLDELNAILLEYEERQTEQINDAIHALQELTHLQHEKIKELKAASEELDKEI